MFALRQLVEKKLDIQGNVALGLVDLVKVFDRVPILT